MCGPPPPARRLERSTEMKIRLSLVLFVLLLFAAAWGVAAITGHAATGAERNEEVARAVIAREKASVEAWQRKDKAFFADLLADDATFFGALNPYLETDPKQNFLPKFEQYAEMFKTLDFQMYNPRVQVYGDTAILTAGEGRQLFVALLISLLLAYVLAHFVRFTGAETARTGLLAGFWIWFGFVATPNLETVLFEGRPLGLYLINNGYHLVGLLGMGALLAVWRRDARVPAYQT